MTIVAAGVAAEITYRQLWVRDGVASARRGHRARAERRARRAAARTAWSSAPAIESIPAASAATGVPAQRSPQPALVGAVPGGSDDDHAVGGSHDDGARAHPLGRPAGRT